MHIKIRNWERFNPKRAQKTYTWLRLDNDFMLQPEMMELDIEQRYVWICMLCWASKKNNGSFKTTMRHIENITTVSEEKILKAFEIMKEWQMIEIITTVDGSEPKKKKQKTTPTRRDETNETNGGSPAVIDYEVENRILVFWNKLNIVKHELSENNFKRVKKALKERKEFTTEQVVQALRNYHFAFKGPSYWTHKWSCWEAIGRENSIQFFPGFFIKENFEGKRNVASSTEYENPYESEGNENDAREEGLQEANIQDPDTDGTIV